MWLNPVVTGLWFGLQLWIQKNRSIAKYYYGTSPTLGIV